MSEASPYIVVIETVKDGRHKVTTSKGSKVVEVRIFKTQDAAKRHYKNKRKELGLG